MRPSRLVRLGPLVLVIVAAIWWSAIATARVAGQPPASAATPGSAATPAGPEQGSRYLAGDALPLLPPGHPSVVDVVAIGAPVRDWFVPIVLRNNTAETVVLTNVSGTAHDASGALLGSAEAFSFITPSIVPAGQVALAHLEFNSADPIPADAVLAFEATAAPLATAQVLRQDLEIVEAMQEADRLVGLARNGTDEALIGKITVLGLCFDAAGVIQGDYAGFADKVDLGPGETAPFTVRLAGTGPCEAFLIGAGSNKKL